MALIPRSVDDKHVPHCHELVAEEQFAGSDVLDARDLVQVKYEMARRSASTGRA
jgi:hypothetical protein